MVDVCPINLFVDEPAVVGFVDVPESDSFSGDDGGSLDPASFVTGLYGGIVLTLPPFFW